MESVLDPNFPVSFWTLALLFAGAFLDATLLFCFFVMGEVFFLAAGWLAVSQGVASPVLAVLLGAFCADQFGYLLGHLGRTRVRVIAIVKHSRRKIYRKVQKLLHKRSVLWIAASRFMGPVAWVTPPVAGALSINYRRFVIGSSLGVFFAAGGFVALGAMGALGMKLASWDGVEFFNQHFWAVIIGANGLALLAVVVSGGWISRWKNR